MSEAEKVGLTSRLEELELRLKLLEARVRKATEPKPKKGKSQPKQPVSGHRCPGCTLELPKGRRGESCVWCGFRFDGVALLESARAQSAK